MPPADQFQPPRKKISIFWWIGVVFFVLIFAFALQLIGPSPRIIVSPQTTHITSPLRPDGLPDYDKYTLDLCRNGITPENNAAALIWPALWPGDLGPAEYRAVAAELGLKSVPNEEDALVDIFKQIKIVTEAQQKVRQQQADESLNAAVPESPTYADPGDALSDFVTTQPWTAAQLPEFAQWAHDNQQPLDLLVEASHRPRCYFPSPSLLDSEDCALCAILLPGVQAVRGATSSLQARAMFELGERHPTEAWRDLLAAHRISHLVAQGHTCVEGFEAATLSTDACAQTVTFLHEAALSPAEARQILRDLNTIEYFSSAANSIDTMERAMFDDAVIRFSRPEDSFTITDDANSLRYLRHFRVNWNVVLERGNDYYDRVVAAARIKDRVARNQALSQVEAALDTIKPNPSPGSLASAAINPAARTDYVTSQIVGMYLPGIRSIIASEDLANTQIELTRLAAALAVYRAEHAAYPEKLADLVPTVIDRLPVDVFTAQPYFYKRQGAGYLLYTAGEDGKDDGGSNESQGLYEGVRMDRLPATESDEAHLTIRPNADDLSIRVPRPSVPLPASSLPQAPSTDAK